MEELHIIKGQIKSVRACEKCGRNGVELTVACNRGGEESGRIALYQVLILDNAVARFNDFGIGVGDMAEFELFGLEALPYEDFDGNPSACLRASSEKFMLII